MSQALRIFDPSRAATVTVDEDKQALLSWLIATSKEPQHVVRMMDDEKTIRDGKKNAPPDESYTKETLRVANKIAGCIHPETWARVNDAAVQAARGEGRPYDMLLAIVKNNEAFRPDDGVLKRRFANEWEAFSLKNARRTGQKTCDDFVATAMRARNVRAIGVHELFKSASRKLHEAFPMKGTEIEAFTTFGEVAAALRRWIDEYALEALQTAPLDGVVMVTHNKGETEERGSIQRNHDDAPMAPCKLCSDINAHYKRTNVDIELQTDHWHRNCPSMAAAVKSDAIRRQIADALSKARIRPRPSQALVIIDTPTSTDEDAFSYTAYDTRVHLAASSTSEHPVILDSGANVNIFTKHQLRHLTFDSPIVGQATIGTFNGTMTALSESATHAVFGPGRYLADGKVDIVSVSVLEDHGWTVRKDPGSFSASNPKHKARFDVTARGLYALSKIALRNNRKPSPLIMNVRARTPAAARPATSSQQRPLRQSDLVYQVETPPATMQPGPSSVRIVQSGGTHGTRATNTRTSKDTLAQQDAVTTKEEDHNKYPVNALRQSHRLVEDPSTSAATLPMNSLQTCSANSAPADDGITIERPMPSVDIGNDASFSVYPSPGCESHGGTLITVAGVVVDASSKKIDSPMPTSSTTAELMQFHRSLAKWDAQRSLVEELGFTIPPSLGLQDNHSTITLLINAFGKALKNKALARRAAEVKDHLKSGKLRLTYQPTDQRAADGLTKPLAPAAFQVFRSRLGVANIEQIHLAGVTGFLGHGGVLGRPGS